MRKKTQEMREAIVRIHEADPHILGDSANVLLYKLDDIDDVLSVIDGKVKDQASKINETTMYIQQNYQDRVQFTENAQKTLEMLIRHVDSIFPKSELKRFLMTIEFLKKRSQNSSMPQTKPLSEQEQKTLYASAYALYNDGNYDTAVQLFTQLVLVTPFNPVFWHGLASSEQMKKINNAALPCLGNRRSAQ